MKVKIFDCDYEKDLEKNLNRFIEEIEKDGMAVKDIKYSTTHYSHTYSFSALVMYGPDLVATIMRQAIEGEEK